MVGLCGYTKFIKFSCKWIAKGMFVHVSTQFNFYLRIEISAKEIDIQDLLAQQAGDKMHL